MTKEQIIAEIKQVRPTLEIKSMKISGKNYVVSMKDTESKQYVTFGTKKTVSKQFLTNILLSNEVTNERIIQSASKTYGTSIYRCVD